VHEHEIISSVLDAVEAMVEREERLGGFSPDFYKKAFAFFAAFADRCHHEKEEVHLFPALEEHGVPSRGGPIGCMLEEHEAGREHVRAATAALEMSATGARGAAAVVRSEAMAYVRLLRNHILKENEVLFVMAERVLPPDVLGDLGKKFEAAEAAMEGGEGHERYVAMARELARMAGTAEKGGAAATLASGAPAGDRMRRGKPLGAENSR
jgi:hemerythrin-like domain-containing protein